jgi:tellurite resistance protein
MEKTPSVAMRRWREEADSLSLALEVVHVAVAIAEAGGL